MNEVDLFSVNISLDLERVLLVKFKNKVDIDIEETKKIMSTSAEMVGKEPFYLITDARDVLSSVDHNSRKYMSEHEVNKHNIAQVIVVNNMSVRILANFYLRFYKRSSPMKVFNKMDEARIWVLSQG